jgi:hypothetical protein
VGRPVDQAEAANGAVLTERPVVVLSTAAAMAGVLDWCASILLEDSPRPIGTHLSVVRGPVLDHLRQTGRRAGACALVLRQPEQG